MKRFWSKVATPNAQGCRLWTGALFRNGYGVACPTSLDRYAHRTAYELAYGVRPGKLVVRHTCDVRACCEPTHLLLGTTQDNINDMWARGRAAKPVETRHYAASNWATKLTESERRALRALWREFGTYGGRGVHAQGVFQRDIGALFGILQSQVSVIIRYESKSVQQYKRSLL